MCQSLEERLAKDPVAPGIGVRIRGTYLQRAGGPATVGMKGVDDDETPLPGDIATDFSRALRALREKK